MSAGLPRRPEGLCAGVWKAHTGQPVQRGFRRTLGVCRNSRLLRLTSRKVAILNQYANGCSNPASCPSRVRCADAPQRAAPLYRPRRSALRLAPWVPYCVRGCGPRSLDAPCPLTFPWDPATHATNMSTWGTPLNLRPPRSPPQPCESNAFVRAIVGVVSVNFWDFSLTWGGGGGWGTPMGSYEGLSFDVVTTGESGQCTDSHVSQSWRGRDTPAHRFGGQLQGSTASA